MASAADEGSQRAEALPAPPVRDWREVITVEPPGYVEMTEAQRRATVAAFTDILTSWWRRHGDTTTADASLPEDDQ
jgi:hypothetical protein